MEPPPAPSANHREKYERFVFDKMDSDGNGLVSISEYLLCAGIAGGIVDSLLLHAKGVISVKFAHRPDHIYICTIQVFERIVGEERKKPDSPLQKITDAEFTEALREMKFIFNNIPISRVSLDIPAALSVEMYGCRGLQKLVFDKFKGSKTVQQIKRDITKMTERRNRLDFKRRRLEEGLRYIEQSAANKDAEHALEVAELLHARHSLK